MQTRTSVRELLELVVECAERETLGKILTILHQGKPVAICRATWRFLLPEIVVGYPLSRRVIDLPLREAPIISPHLSVAEALIRLREDAIPNALALEGTALRGMVPLRGRFIRCHPRPWAARAMARPTPALAGLAAAAQGWLRRGLPTGSSPSAGPPGSTRRQRWSARSWLSDASLAGALFVMPHRPLMPTWEHSHGRIGARR
jgi:hypothetical protein